VEDVLARRTRALFLNAQAASEMAEKTATIMARELNYNDTWKANQIQSFRKLAQQYAAPAQ
jgi:glycerol-3-phosphate dehydrogenase